MKISIVTPTYNSINTIKDSIESVYSQSYSNYEHIIIDGASTDGTHEWLEVNSRLHSHLISEPDGGIYDALNKGFLLATGDVLGLMHSDDFYPSSNILEEVSSIFLNPSVGVVYGDLDYVSKVDIGKIIRRWRPGIFDKNKLRFGWMPPHPALFIRRSLFQKLGGFDLRYSISSDYDFLVRLFTSSGFSSIYLPQTLMKMRVGGVSNRSFPKMAQKSYEDYLIIKRNHIGGVFTLLSKNFSKIGQFIH